MCNIIDRVRYTHFVDCPLDSGLADGGTRRSISKAIARGLTVTKVLEPELVTRCPAKTDERVEAGRRQRITVRGCDNRTILVASDGRRCSTWRYCPSVR